jgi:hypothetical protein
VNGEGRILPQVMKIGDENLKFSALRELIFKKLAFGRFFLLD